MSDMFEGVKMSQYDDRLRLYGIGSDFDTKGLLDATLEALKLKDVPYLNTKKYYETEKKAWSNFKAQLTAFTDTTKALKDVTSSDKLVTVSDPSVLTVRATNGALESNYSIVVNKVATAHKVISSPKGDPTVALGYEGTVKVNDVDFNFTSNMTLNDVATKLNSGTYGVYAVVVGGSLITTSRQTGAANAIRFTDSGAVTAQPATKQVVSSTGFTNLSTDPLDYSGDFEIKMGDGTVQKFTISAGQSLDDIVNTINTTVQADGSASKIVASVVNGQLQMESVTEGMANSFTIMTDNATSPTSMGSFFKDIGMIAADNTFTNQTSTASDATNANDGILKDLGLINTSNLPNEVQKAQDAIFTIDGIELTNGSNVVTNAIAGVTLTLNKVTAAGENVNVGISQNNDLLKEKVKKFVEDYNKMVMYINAVAGKEAILQGKTIPTRAKMDMAAGLMTKTDSTLLLYKIGIEIDGVMKDGTVKFNETKLMEELNKNPEEVMKLLTGENSVSDFIYDKMYLATKATGTLDTTITGLDERIKKIDKTLEKNAQLFEQERQTLLRKFATFELMMGDLNLQMQYMEAQIKAMNGDK